jgi:hypothetical protein
MPDSHRDEPSAFSVLSLALSYVANIYIFIILYDLCLLPAYVSNEIVYVRKF